MCILNFIFIFIVSIHIQYACTQNSCHLFVCVFFCVVNNEIQIYILNYFKHCTQCSVNNMCVHTGSKYTTFIIVCIFNNNNTSFTCQMKLTEKTKNIDFCSWLLDFFLSLPLFSLNTRFKYACLLKTERKSYYIRFFIVEHKQNKTKIQ